ncbi:(2Fe-2S) ferredoxin domain-containing protein [Ectothiorhodospiraceae bacterium BW-2]|nr:(2Fe-2S) ferredoxin domain-containing protein [Ectothiorhodospiraceae bacterium BW-2]
MSYYQHHLFFCQNRRDEEQPCCGRFAADKLRDYAKKRCKELNLTQEGRGVRVNSAGCLNRCGAGPVLVIYPDAVWYTYVDRDDIDEIIESHLQRGKVVERLLVDRSL